MNLGFGTSTYSIKSPGFIKYLKEDGKAKTLVRTGGASKFSKKAGERSLTELKKYWIYYSKEGTVFAALNSTAFNTILVGSSIQSMDSDAKQLIEDICFNVDLEGALLEATLHSLIFGDSYLEKRRTADGNIVKLHPVDPQTMVINYNEFGDIVSYQQKISGRLIEPVIKPEDIIHIRFLPIPGSPYGVSLIEPNVDIIERKLSIEEAIYNAMIRHGTGKWVIYVGSEKDGQTPPDDVMDKIAEKFENINEINEVVLPWFIKLEAVDEQGIEGVDTYYDYFQTQLVVGLMCPEEALGQGKGSTEACYDEKTEVLTKRGWVKHIDLYNEDLIATYNPSQDAIEYKKSLEDVKEHIYEHDGPMIKFKSQKIDMMVTPNHRMWVNKNPTLTKEKWEFATAEEIYNSNSHWAIKSRATREEPVSEYDSKLENLMKFIGYFVSEGSVNKDSIYCRLSQKKELSARRMKEVMANRNKSYKVSYSDEKGYEWHLYDKDEYKWLKRFGDNCYNRHIPREYIDKDKYYLDKLLFAALDGDGTFDNREGRNYAEYCSTSKQLADDIQEIALKCGYRTNMFFSEDKRDNRVGCWRVSIDLSDKDYCIITPSMCDKVYYKGIVNCLNVPNHIYLTRRNNKVAIQGNTARVKSIMYERMIKAYQQRISQIVRTELFNETLLKHGFVNKETKLPIKVELIFNSVTEEDEALRAKWLGNLLRGFPDGDMPFTRNEIRAFFNLPQREDMENIPESSNEEDKEPKEERPKPKPKEELVEEEDEEDEENE